MQHWKEGGHDQLCKKIKKAGGAEQYNANQKYTEAVAVAAEACAEDTKGQTCYGLLAGPEYSSDDIGDGPVDDAADLDELSRRAASNDDTVRAPPRPLSSSPNGNTPLFNAVKADDIYGFHLL